MQSIHQSVQEQLAFYETLFQNAPVGFACVDRDLRMVRMNDAFARIEQAAFEQPIGKHLSELMPSLWPTLEVICQRVLVGETILHDEIILDGNSTNPFLRYFLVNYHPIRVQAEVVGIGIVFNEITEQKREKLAAPQVAAIITDAEYSIVSQTVDGIITTWNPGAERLYGYRAEETIGRKVDFLLPDEHREELTRQRHRIFQGETIPAFDTVRLHRDGRRIDVSISLAPVRNQIGEIIGISGIGIDITERKKIERERAVLQSIVEYSPDAVGIVSVQDQIQFLNPSARNQLGITDSNEIRGRQIREVLSPADADRFRNQMLPALHREEIWTGEIQIHNRTTGQITPVEWTLFPVPGRDESGTKLFAFIAHDISQRLRIEAQQKRTEERLRTLLDRIPEPLFVYDRETLQYLSVNDAAIAIYGYSREEFLKMTIRDIRPPEDIGPLMNMLARSETVFENRGVWRHRKKDGTIFHVEITAHALELESRPACIILAHDVTEKLRAEAELRRSEERYRELIETIPALMWVYDGHGDPIMHNRRWYEYTGQTPEDIRNDRWFEVIHPEDRHLARSAWDRSKSTGEAYSIEYRLRKIDGTHRWFLSQGIPLVGKNGIELWVGLCTDIDDRKRAENDSRQNAGLLRAVAENLPDAVFVKDLEGRYLLCNPAAASFVGTAPEDFIGKTDFDFFDSRSAELIWERDRAVIQSGEVQTNEEELTFGGLTRIFLATKGPYRDAEGKIIGVLGISRDISDRKRLEQQFLQAQKMEAVGQLAGGIAHDFNNLLTVINGYSEMVLSELPQTDPLHEPLIEIHRSGMRASSLTRQLLAFSRQQVLEPRILNLNTIIVDIEKMLRRLIGEDIDLSTILSPEIDLVKADPGQIEQVLINLAVNARDAMPTGGKLTIETRNIIFDREECFQDEDLQPGRYVMASLTDTGHGMDEATKSHIFEPFFTTKGVGKGTGLGLATVHGIIKQSRGHITVVSQVNQGTTFRIYLPTALAESVGSTLVSEVKSMPLGRETILFVEDEDAVRAFGARILRECGYRVFEAINGLVALEFSKHFREKIDLLISDVVMPHLGGRALAEQFASIRNGCKVLFLSGYTDDAIIRHGVLDAEFAFLQKPFTPSALAQKVRNVLDQNRG